ncbi:hypothetical protein C8R44DRAFT_731244 [Mycena epipterygia]|nr:hypothetical protein C8R44DRAFT_731244 [Mycena epipterygia]
MSDTAPAVADAPLSCGLQWIWATHTIPPEVKILSVVKILRDMKMSPIDLVTTLLVPQDVYRENADGFYRSKGLENMLNLVYRDKRGRKKIQKWFDDNGAMDGLLSDIHHEMDGLSAVFRRSTADITPESLLNFDFEKDVTEICRQHTPKLRRILIAAAQTPPGSSDT